MEYCLFRTIGKYTFCIIKCARPRALNMPTSDYLHSADSLKNIYLGFLRFLILSFQLETRGNCAFCFLHTNAALEVKNMVQFAWAKNSLKLSTQIAQVHTCESHARSSIAIEFWDVMTALPLLINFRISDFDFFFSMVN